MMVILAGSSTAEIIAEAAEVKLSLASNALPLRGLQCQRHQAMENKAQTR